MIVYIVDLLDYFALVEYQEKGSLYRKLISRDIYQSPVKYVETQIAKKHLNVGIEYSDIGLIDNLGENYLGIRVRDLEQAMRRAGLWTRKDYQNKPDAVAKVLKDFPGLDVTTVQNAAIYVNEQGDLHG